MSSPDRNLEEVDPRVGAVEDVRSDRPVALTAIVVAYREPDRLRRCLDSLRSQSTQDFEVVIAHNGGAIIDESWKEGLNALCIHFRENYRQVVGRNVAATYARSPLLYFIDDDSVVAPTSIANLIEFFATRDVVACRGRMHFQTDIMYNLVARHYDLGEEIRPGQIHENGLAMRREVHDRFQGYDESLVPGNEGNFWLYHLVKNYGRERVVYFPGAALSTDYARSLRHFLAKTYGYQRHLTELRADRPEWFELRRREQLNSKDPWKPYQKTPKARFVRNLQRVARQLGRLRARRRA